MAEKRLTGSPIAYALERSNRTTVGIYVERDGSVLVRAPLQTPQARIDAAVQTKSEWIFKAQGRWSALNKVPARKEFVSGETVYFLGQPHRLDFTPDGPVKVERHGDVMMLSAQKRGVAEALLKEFYRAEGLRRLPDLVAQHAASMGLTPGAIRVQELGHRWGSCSDKGNLNFHWKAMAVPVDVLHYLVVHELAHLVHKNHSPRFWGVVEKELAGWKPLAQWLDQHGAMMTL